ncbi:MAG: PKD domain-containing protein, partial [Crocinitomicaceae bacterium]|nr:PKD domain-containing protein [Crocinitomicaceae bacterium]
MRYKNKLTNFVIQKYSVHSMLNRFKLLLLILFIFFFLNFSFSQCNNLQVNAGSDVVLCAGSAGVQLNASATGGGGSYTYSWTTASGNPANGLSCNNCSNPIATSPGQYELTVNGCNQDSDIIVVTSASSPTANFTFTPNNACGNLPVQFTNTSTGNGLTYSWNFGDPTSGNNTSTASNPTHTFSATGAANVNYNVTLTVTNSNGCSSTSTQVVTVKPLPVSTLVDYAFDFKNCDGTSFNMTVNETNTSAGIANFQIQWGDGTADFSGPTFPVAGITHTYTTQEIFNLTYTLTGANGCTNTYTQIVSNITNPSIGAANPGGTNGCGPLQICFPLSNYTNNHPSTTYRVNFGDGSPILNLPHPPPSVLCHTYTSSSCGYPGNAFTFRMKAINLCDSSEATITPIRVYSPPTANFSNPAAACTNSSVAFTNLTTGSYTSSCSSASTFVWNFGDGTGSVTVNNTATQFHAFSSPGTYTVTLTASNVTCGSSTITRVICIENPPIPQYVISQNQGCVPFTTQVTNSSTSLNTCAVATAWTVTFNGNSCNSSSGSFSYVGGTSASSFSPNFQFNSPGTYSIQYSMTNSCGTFISTKAITAQSSPLISMSNLSTICAGQSANPAASFNSCYETIDTYNWTFTNGSPASSSLANPPTITFNTAGNQIISLQATNACGTATASTSILVNPIPPLLNPTVNSPLCVGSTAFFSATSVPGVVYHWSGPNGFSTTQQNFQINNITTGYSGTYSVYGTIGNCQGPTQSVSLIVNPLPIVSAGSDFSICQNAVPVTLGGSPAGGNWSGFGVSGGILTPFNAGNYTLTYNYTNPSTGCSAIDYASVTVNPVPLTNAGIDQTFCNQPIPNTLTGSPAGGTWTGAGITNPIGQFTPTSNGTFPVVYTSTNIFGCIKRDTMIITVVNPSPVNAGSDQTICANDANVQLIGAPINGTWTGSGITSGGLFDPTVAGTFPMVYSLGGGSCQTKDTMLFIVNPIPVVNAGANFNICIDAPIYSLTASPVGGTWTGTGIVGNTFNPLTAG